MLYQPLAEFTDGVDEQIKIAASAAMVRHGNTHCKAASDSGARSHGNAALLELTQNLVIQRVDGVLVAS